MTGGSGDGGPGRPRGRGAVPAWSTVAGNPAVGRPGSRRALAQQAAMKALRVRQAHGVGLADPVCPYDLAERLEVEVRFVPVPSMEGMYLKPAAAPDPFTIGLGAAAARPTVLVSSLRPAGRQTFTCAHELGHHAFGHGNKIDEYLDAADDAGGQVKRFDPEEFLADTFAGLLLMPKTAVDRVLADRGLDPAVCEPAALFAVAGLFGVGYGTLVQHLRYGLNLLPGARADVLLRAAPKALRAALFGQPLVEDLWVVDQHWRARPVDVQVGDVLLVPAGTRLEGDVLEAATAARPPAAERTTCGGAASTALRARAPGASRLVAADGRWGVAVRVASRAFAGRAIFRHEPDVDEPDIDGSDIDETGA